MTASESDDSTRREFIVQAATTVIGLTTIAQAARAQVEPMSQETSCVAITNVSLTVNGASKALHLDSRTTLLDALREQLHLTGTKKGCDRGECGACTVHVDGRRVLACTTLAVMADGRQVTTIEGIARGDALHPMQTAFIEHDAFQCGYCTSGQIMSAIACVREGHATSAQDVSEYMSGNICRCAAYPQIRAAVLDVARQGSV